MIIVISIIIIFLFLTYMQWCWFEFCKWHLKSRQTHCKEIRGKGTEEAQEPMLDSKVENDLAQIKNDLTDIKKELGECKSKVDTLNFKSGFDL